MTKYLNKNTCGLFLIALITTFFLNACNQTSTSTEAEASKYLPLINDYCTKNNLEIKNYLGKTNVVFKYSPHTKDKPDQVIYEWQVIKKSDTNISILRVGPIFSDFPKLKPMITLAKERYNIK